MMPDIFATLQKASISCSQEQADALGMLIDLLHKWNQKLNLTAISDKDEMVIMHIFDCASASPYLGDAVNIADVGTGAGFPGLVLAILNRGKSFTLIDSVAKKLSFVMTAKTALKLDNVTIINKRCENIKPKDPFDLIISRAFAPLERMASWCLPLLSEDGTLLAMKANLEEAEIKAVPEGVKITAIKEVKVPLLEAKRQLVFLKRSHQLKTIKGPING